MLAFSQAGSPIKRPPTLGSGGNVVSPVATVKRREWTQEDSSQVIPRRSMALLKSHVRVSRVYQSAESKSWSETSRPLFSGCHYN